MSYNELYAKFITCDRCRCMMGFIDGSYGNYAGVKCKNLKLDNIKNSDLDFCVTCWKQYVRKSRGRIGLLELISLELNLNITEYECIGWECEE